MSLPHKPYAGVFITIEGGEGVGKTTLAASLYEHLQKMGHDVLKTREPGGSKLSEHIRKVLLDPNLDIPISDRAELFLFLAARAEHLDELILPALHAGKIVICERFNDSTIAYQGYARNLGVEYVQKLCSAAFPKIEPDCTFFLDIDPEMGLRRAKNQRGAPLDRLELEKMQFHTAVRQGFLHLLDEHPERIYVLDAQKPPLEVVQAALSILNRLIKPK